ncbi:MAG: PAS domain S-box protein, partial [Lentimicrobium sp.]|nr:PAS domain S-box protein [Lentimicrobium sp.]
MKIKGSKFLRGRNVLTISVVLFVITIAVGAYVYYNNEIVSARKDKSNELRSIAALKQSQISAWYADQLMDATVLSQNSRLLAAISAAVTSGSEEEKEAVNNYLDELKLEHGYNEVILTNNEGALLFTTENTVYAPDEQLVEYIRQSVVQKKVISTDLYKCHFHNNVHIDFLAPLDSPEFTEPVVMILRMNPDDFIYPLLSYWPGPGRTSETVLLRKEGDSILMLNELRFHKNSALSLRISLNSNDIPAVKAASGYEGAFDGKDYRGADVFAYLNAVHGTPWFMVTKVDKAELFQDSVREARLLILFLVLIILFTAAILSFIYTFRQRNIFRRLLQVKEEFRTTIYSIGDAVIITDKSGNLSNLNPVAEALTGWTEKDAVGKSIEEVFRIINEGTRQKVESPIDKVLKEGSIVGLANHTLLIARDGKEIPIADSGAPIRDDEGLITGVVLVFRDQTEEHAHQAALQESELKYRLMFESSPQPMWFYDIDSLAFLEVNQAAISHYGYSQAEFLSMTLRDIRPQEDIPALIQDVADTSEAYNTAGVWRHKKKNGELIFVEIISHEVIFNNKAARHVLVNDITDRKKSQEALVSAEKYFRTLIEKAPDGIVLLNANGKITYASPSAIRIFSDGDSMEIPDPNDSTHPDDLPKVLSAIQQVVEDPTLTLTLEYRFKTNLGRYRWVESTFSNQLSEPGIESVIINFRDITDRK